jgi:hypothetical protein
MPTQQSSHEKKIIIKGYGWVAAGIASFLICEKGIPAENITIFEDKDEIGGCWLEANTHSETINPIIGIKQAYYPTYDRIQNIVTGSPLIKNTMIENLRRIREELKFNLVLSTKIIDVNEKEKCITVQNQDSSQAKHKYDVLVAPHYRTMNSYNRTISLSDGIRKIDISKYKCFKFVGNGLNTAETIKYIIDTLDPRSDYEIEIYYRNAHPTYPRVAVAFPVAGLPVLFGIGTTLSVLRFVKMVDNPSFKQYLDVGWKAPSKHGFGDLKLLMGDFLFHPFVANKLKFIHYPGKIEEIPVGEQDLLIDTRNDVSLTRGYPSHTEHFQIEMGHVSHPLANSYVYPHFSLITRGIHEMLWDVIEGRPPNDRYFQRASNKIDSQKLGHNFWNYCHDVQARIVPFAYWFFPIATIPAALLWFVCYRLAVITGLIAFFIDLDTIEKASYLVDESTDGYEKLVREWETLNARSGISVPYPISVKDFTKAQRAHRHSLIGLKKNVNFYRSVRRIYPWATGVVASAFLGLAFWRWH